MGDFQKDDPLYLEADLGDYDELLWELPDHVRLEVIEGTAEGLMMGIGKHPVHGLFVDVYGQGESGPIWCQWWDKATLDDCARRWEEYREAKRQRLNFEAEGDDILTREYAWWEQECEKGKVP